MDINFSKREQFYTHVLEVRDRIQAQVPDLRADSMAVAMAEDIHIIMEHLMRARHVQVVGHLI